MINNADGDLERSEGISRHRLMVYVSAECFSCQEAVQLAADVAQQFPQIITEVVDIDDPSAAKPETVFAVPTYILNGNVLGLGNPYPDQLFARIVELISTPATGLEGAERTEWPRFCSRSQ